MRQAGRYMPEYRALRAQYSLLDICRTPDLATEVTLQPIRRLEVDAAILFSDLLLPLEPMGLPFDFIKGEGPQIERPIKSPADIDRLRAFDPRTALAHVLEAIGLIQQELAGRVPLIGFVGAPFTLASYAIEGGHSNNFARTKSLMYGDTGAWEALMNRLVPTLVKYLAAQAEAGCQLVQIFDSWAGCLSPDDYRRYVLPHSRRLIESLPEGLPVVHFLTGNPALLPLQREAGGDVQGLDWRVDLADGWKTVGHDVAIQGNLDPVSLFTDLATLRERTAAVLDAAERRPGHIFNLGHGLMPGMDPEKGKALVEMVHEMGTRE